MTTQKLDKAKKLHDDLSKWESILNDVFNKGLSCRVDTLEAIRREIPAACFNKIRDLLTSVADKKLKELKKEFDEL